MIKVVFFDVDGTLLSHTKFGVPEGNREALEKLKEKGVLRVVATGRHRLELERLPVNDLEFDGCITLNGQLCFDEHKNVFYENQIDGEIKKRILRIFREKEIPVLLVEKDAVYINFVDERVMQAQKEISTPVPPIGEYTGAPVYQAVVYVRKEEEAALRELLPDCIITRWNDNAVDIMPTAGGKTTGIEKYLQLTHISREETMAFGDGENDKDMLQFAGIGVAMGNACAGAKNAADYVTASVDEDGIKKALRQYGIIE